MRKAITLFMVLAGASVASAQQQIILAPNFQMGPAPCRGADLAIRHVSDDAAMGGHNLTAYGLKNESAAPCTLKGYPKFELLNRSAHVMPRGRAVNSRQLMGDEAAQAPQLVTVDAGKEAIFRVYTNNGGAGRVGKPCPSSRWVRVVPPGTTRAFVLKDNLTSCVKVQVSAVRVMSGTE